MLLPSDPMQPGTHWRFLLKSVKVGSVNVNGAPRDLRMIENDRDAYAYVVNNLITSLKSSYYISIIHEHASDQKCSI